MRSLVRFRAATVAYEGSNGPVALHALDLDVAPGEVVALVGPSGAGKTTVLNLSNGLVLPTTGSVEVLGASTASFDRRTSHSVRRRIATIHQNFALVEPLSVARNVANARAGHWSSLDTLRESVRPRHADAIAEVLDRVGIADKMWSRVDELSGGQRQRVAVARALHQDSSVLIADEPVSSLDPARAEQVMALLASTAAAGERAVVASMHDAPLALAHATRVIGLRDGHVQFDLPAGDVRPGQLEQLYMLTHRPPPARPGDR